jgi:hypothetical protein
MCPVYFVNYVTGLHPSYFLSLRERKIEVRPLTLTLSQRERELWISISDFR